MAVKMIALILLGVFAGQYLDGMIEMQTPIATLVLTLGAVFFSMYIFIRDVSK